MTTETTKAIDKVHKLIAHLDTFPNEIPVAQVEVLAEIAVQLMKLNEHLSQVIGRDAWGHVSLFTQSADSRPTTE